MTTDPSSSVARAPEIRKRAFSRLLREPLLHFLVLGAVLFEVDYGLNGSPNTERTIVVGPEVEREAREVFRASRMREPTAEELETLRRVWLHNEVLYREGLAMQVDRGDSTIRERVIFKALSMVEANLKPPAIDDDGLRAWFEKNRAKYDEPPRYDFQEAVPTSDPSEAAVRALAQTLNKGAGGEVSAGLRVFKGRPRANIAQSYGEAFAAALDQATPGEWRVYEAAGAWRVIRLETIAAARPADFEALRGVVLHDWTDATMAELRTAAVSALARKYDIKLAQSK